MLFDFYDNLPFTPLSAIAVENLSTALTKSKHKGNLKAIYEPEFIHESGVECIAILLDWVHFLREIVNESELNMIKQDSEDMRKC